MHRYLLRFYKKNNIRFISHLDLGRLFKRAIRKAEVKIGFSNGYNPHELINIVQPLSLGYESDSEYFEVDTVEPYDTEWLCSALNESLPDGIKFTICKEIPAVSSNLSNKCQYAVYEAVLPLKNSYAGPLLADFLKQEHIYILKKEKKTKKLVEKDVKDMILDVKSEEEADGETVLKMILRCASNETLNPGKLLESFFKFAGGDAEPEYIKIKRIDILGNNINGELVSLYEIV